MSAFKLKHLLAGVAMLTAAAGAVALKPTVRMAEQRPINLERMIPQQFGDWKLDQSIAPVQVDPEVQAKLDKIYSQVLSRTYMNPKGERVMLSIAYGSDQTKEAGAHRPEVCYPAQGFSVSGSAGSKLGLAVGSVPVRRLIASRGSRVEPITYWLVVGDEVIESGWRQKLAMIGYGLGGVIADGKIVRISSIGSVPDVEFGLQNRFLNDFVQALSPVGRAQMFGSSLKMASQRQ